jgi:hypothetical protein
LKIYVAAVEGLRKKERQDENSVYDQNWWFSEFHSHWMLMYFLAGFLKISPCEWPNSVFVLLYG